MFICLALEPRKRRRQITARAWIAPVAVGGVSEAVLAHAVKEGLILFFGLLDKRQRRLFAGPEALNVGQYSGAWPPSGKCSVMASRRAHRFRLQ